MHGVNNKDIYYLSYLHGVPALIRNELTKVSYGEKTLGDGRDDAGTEAAHIDQVFDAVSGGSGEVGLAVLPQ